MSIHFYSCFVTSFNPGDDTVNVYTFIILSSKSKSMCPAYLIPLATICSHKDISGILSKTKKCDTENKDSPVYAIYVISNKHIS